MTLDKIEETYGDKVRIVFRDFPLPNHNRAQHAAEAAQCANDQGKFWEYHDALFDNPGAMAPDDLKAIAVTLELDTDLFNACVDSREHTASVMQDHDEGAQVGVTGTPAFFINGRFLSGAQPFEAFEKIIDEELSR